MFIWIYIFLFTSVIELWQRQNSVRFVKSSISNNRNELGNDGIRAWKPNEQPQTCLKSWCLPCAVGGIYIYGGDQPNYQKTPTGIRCPMVSLNLFLTQHSKNHYKQIIHRPIIIQFGADIFSDSRRYFMNPGRW